jgi:hypothetical protein
MAKHYKITNTTVKPARLDPTTGADLRKISERVGHAVSYLDDSGRSVAIQAGDTPRFLSKRNPGVDRLEAAGYIAVEEVDDITTALRNHVMSSPAVRGAVAKADTEATADITAPVKARAVEMGESSAEAAKVAATEYEGATNPDGDPNFVVKAKSSKKKEATSTPASL